MRKTRSAVWAIIFLLGGFVVLTATGAQGVAEQKPLFENIDSLLRSKEDELDLTKAILEISAQGTKDLLGQELDIGKYSGEIDRMAQDIRARIKSANNGEEIVAAINRYLFDDCDFQVDRSQLWEGSLETLLLNSVLDTKKGHCLSLSLIYLGLGEKLGLPLSGIKIPEHIFVRYDGADKTINIETTNKGRNQINGYYIQQHFYGKTELADFYKLSKREIIAIYLNNLANEYKKQGRFDEAISLFHKALSVNDTFEDIHTNLGNVYERKGMISDAINQYKKALDLNPYLCTAHYNLGLAHYLYTKNLRGAIKHGRIAESLGCRMHPRFRSFLQRNRHLFNESGIKNE